MSEKSAKKSPKVWKIREKCLSLQRQNNSFGYPGDIPAWEQDWTDTTPFKKGYRLGGSLFVVDLCECCDEIAVFKGLTGSAE